MRLDPCRLNNRVSTNALVRNALLSSQDNDVESETERVRTGQVDSNSAIIIKNLVKVY